MAKDYYYEVWINGVRRTAMRTRFRAQIIEQAIKHIDIVKPNIDEFIIKVRRK